MYSGYFKKWRANRLFIIGLICFWFGGMLAYSGVGVPSEAYPLIKRAQASNSEEGEPKSDTLILGFSTEQKWLLALDGMIELVENCDKVEGTCESFELHLVESPLVISRTPYYRVQFVVNTLPQDFNKRASFSIRKSHNIKSTELFSAVAGVDFNSSIINNLFGHSQSESGLSEEGSAVKKWIAPRFLTENRSYDTHAYNTCLPGEVDNEDYTEYPHQCLASIKVISQGAYEARFQIYDNFGNFVYGGRQKFGNCGELKNTERTVPGGYASWLVWNLEDTNHHPVGSGVYLWRVQLFSKDKNSVPKVFIYKQGIARTDKYAKCGEAL